jgi:hypothetical protein
MSSRDFKDRTPIAKQTIDTVMSKLIQLGHPATVKELMKLTGKSYNTVRLALVTGGAVSLGEYPERYEPGEYVVIPASSAPLKGVVLMVPQVPDIEDFAGRWNRNRNVFSQRLGELAIQPSADPESLIRQFTSGASTLATMAELLEQVKDKPDWHELLMGESNG